MTKNKMLFRLIVLGAILLIIGIGITYAYFNSSMNKNKENTKTNIISGKIDVDFVTSKYIHNTDTWLINDEDLLIDGDNNIFSIKRAAANTTKDIYYNIYLDEIEITDNLKSTSFKWRLYDTATPTIESNYVASGNFSLLGNKTTLQLNQAKIYLSKNDTHNYSLYIWLSNDLDTNQLELLEGSFSAKIKLEAASV